MVCARKGKGLEATIKLFVSLSSSFEDGGWSWLLLPGENRIAKRAPGRRPVNRCVVLSPHLPRILDRTSVHLKVRGSLASRP